MLNKVQLIGRLGKDPEIRYTQGSEAVANVSLATSESWKDKNGEKQEKTEWHNLVFYRRLAEMVGEHLKKGALIYVEGKITTEKYQKDGEDRYVTKIVVSEMKMLGGNKTDDESHVAAPAPAANKGKTTKAGQKPKLDEGSF
ncbi:Single-stranded DNA-binding protein [Candidatus Nitrotoga sp. HW29]|uniref:single-stranded DNA-binding protein n=1 Tax=Candidatus Nitrotoga sp. HW29 TaxID=2886963 RepID=UPI000E37FF1D|nr:single-stranded DNA-binding protein [Candidatus Nitrotoga sp. HW29]RFC31762.1 MAG: single-strand binding protein [Candidatus Nitrotoga sp. SPKER]CAH1905024.1 Single-stranded DNA-binding protein [Candidatus Nitrotoga sp. HW29]